MQPEDEERLRLARAWLDRARSDLTVAARAAVAPPALNVTVFLCQQAAEKALKAFLTWHDRPFGRTHALDELLFQCVELDGSLADLEQGARRLSPYAVEPRYPTEHGDPTPEEADEAQHSAKVVVDAIQSRPPDRMSEN